MRSNEINPVIVAFTGSVYSGKTTTLNQTAKLLEAYGHKVVKSDEAAKEVLERYAERLYGTNNLSEVLNDMRKSPLYLEFQRDVIESQYNIERLAYLEAVKQKAHAVLIDRTILDWLWFFMLYCGKYSKSDLFRHCLTNYNQTICSNAHYDIVFLCDYIDVGEEYDQNGYRSLDDITYDSRFAQHNFIEALLKISKFDYYELTGEPNERAEYAAETIQQLIIKRFQDSKGGSSDEMDR